MPRLIKDGAIVEDNWLAADADAASPHHSPQKQQILTLQQWQALADKSGSAVQIEPGEGIEALLKHLDSIALVAIDFPVFMDGRGFSYGRELRERGYTGELRAVGSFIRDQLTYLSRLGFNAFQFAEDSHLDSALESLADFSEYYQASINQPQPLFRRRA